MKWKTSLSNIQNGKEYIRGHELTDLIKGKSFVEVIYLLWKGALPNKNEARMLNALFTACIDHGVGAPSATVARTVASTGNSAHVALSAGLAALGDLHGGAIEGAAKFFRENVNVKDLKGMIKFLRAKKIKVPGYGHKVLTHDERTDALFEVAKETGFFGKYCTLAVAVAKEFEDKKVPLNIDGAMAAIILDMGFDPSFAKGFFFVGRVPGLIAHIHEEQASGEGLRRISEEEVEYLGK